MGQHKVKVGFAAYKAIQWLGAPRVLVADSRSIKTKRAMLRRTPKGTVFFDCPPLRLDLADRIRDAVTRRLKVGLGKAERIEAKAARP